jgi:hypothetical protein
MMGIKNVWLDKIDPDHRISDGTFLMLLQAKTDFNIGHSSNEILCIFPLRARQSPETFSDILYFFLSLHSVWNLLFIFYFFKR